MSQFVQFTMKLAVTIVLGAAATANITDLGDIAVGGDGSGSAPIGTGVRSGDGTLVDSTTYGGSSYGPFGFHPTDGSNGSANLPYVDGVFVPRGSTVITSGGTTFQFPSTSGYRYDAIRNAAAVYDNYYQHTWPIQLSDQPGVDRRGVGMHSNNGITYDLADLRQDGYVFDGVHGVAGISDQALPNPSPSIEAWVIVDGVQQYHQTFLDAGLTWEAFTVPLSANAQRLTIAITDHNHNNSADWGVFADLALVPEPNSVLLLVVVAGLCRRVGR